MALLLPGDGCQIDTSLVFDQHTWVQTPTRLQHFSLQQLFWRRRPLSAEMAATKPPHSSVKILWGFFLESARHKGQISTGILITSACSSLFNLEFFFSGWDLLYRHPGRKAARLTVLDFPVSMVDLTWSWMVDLRAPSKRLCPQKLHL